MHQLNKNSIVASLIIAGLHASSTDQCTQRSGSFPGVQAVVRRSPRKTPGPSGTQDVERASSTDQCSPRSGLSPRVQAVVRRSRKTPGPSGTQDVEPGTENTHYKCSIIYRVTLMMSDNYTSLLLKQYIFGLQPSITGTCIQSPVTLMATLSVCQCHYVR